MRFRLIIDRTKEEEVVVTAHEKSALTGRIEQLVMDHTGSGRIAAYTEDETKLLSFSRIECITVLDGKTWAVDVRGERFRLRQRLYELEEMLPACFIRINKSALANEDRLDRFETSFNGAVDAVFKCGYREYVSRRCFAAIRRRFDGK